MLSLIYPTLKLLQLRGSPADFPYRPTWLAGLLLADVALTLLQYRLLAVPGLTAVVVVAPLLHMGLVAGVLWLRSRTQRWVQTLTAMLAIWVLLGLLLLPPILVLAALGVKLAAVAPGGTVDTATRFLDLLLLTLLLWRVLAEAHVLKYALDLPLGAALTIALALLLGEQWLLYQLAAISAAAPATPL